jgi:hypothetical protein
MKTFFLSSRGSSPGLDLSNYVKKGPYRSDETVQRFTAVNVPDSVSRDRVVVFVGAGCWGNLRRDARNLEWGGVEKGEVSS